MNVSHTENELIQRIHYYRIKSAIVMQCCVRVNATPTSRSKHEVNFLLSKYITKWMNMSRKFSKFCNKCVTKTLNSILYLWHFKIKWFYVNNHINQKLHFYTIHIKFKSWFTLVSLQNVIFMQLIKQSVNVRIKNGYIIIIT